MASFDRTVAMLYEAALDDARWPAVFTAMDELCGLRGGQLTATAADSRGVQQIEFAVGFIAGEERDDIVSDWVENYAERSEHIPRILRLPVAELRHNEQLFTDLEKKTSAMYNEFQPRYDCRNQSAVLLDRPGGTARPDDCVFWLMAREYKLRSPDWWPEDVARIEGLLPAPPPDNPRS